ncbi:RNA polymerase sigma-70 factor, ECF subfamily [Alteribacillus persepolensis]|uniref:RNA polymerase sigma-70 factor, ECF subfamily n=1 Tax=Alteribacillus persepolensis TaxID=568899 RepID=A0A1G8KMD8_9BACI|nr:sigma-70 family RNA polymerase sigma factor [Alteribacillus persepolensis]SDI44595.1 RNA polymerase sigma-70 factor, ECF subfamily [Alteribacillus persepolensis]
MEEGKKEEMLERIMIEYGSGLVRLAFSYVKDKETAKDMVQNTFIKCYENLDNFRFESSIKTWLYRITINQCKDYLRSWHFRRVQARSFLESAIGTFLPSAEDNLIKNTEAKEMKRLIFSLSKNHREVIFLYYYESLSIKEIAEVAELNVNTVKTRLSRAKQRLKILIEEGNAYE